MNIAKFSIQRPIFISSIVILMLITGWVSLNRLGVDLFPDVNIPVVTVQTIYRGASPEEVENLISKPLEEELSSISGLKRLTSRNQESLSVVVAEFTLSTDIKYAEQQVRDKTARVRRNLPDGIEEPLVIRFDPADQSIVKFALSADLPAEKLYDLAKEKIKPQLERIPNVGSIKISGGVRREVQIELDRDKLNSYKVPAVVISNQLKSAGSNIPVGKNSLGSTETSYRTIGEFDNLKQIENAVVSFSGDYGNGVTIGEIGKVIDGTEEETTKGYLYAPVEERKPIPFIYTFLGIQRERQVLKREKIQCIFLDVYKQSGSNTVQVANDVIEKVKHINEELQKNEKSSKKDSKIVSTAPKLRLIFDSSKWIRFNIEDVSIAIILGIILAVVVVYLFLGNIRSTIITGLALPNSLLGAFILMLAMGFSINVMSLLALSLTVGLLVDDAIVVRENIFRKLEEGMPVPEAAEKGTTEVMLAVIATTATIIAVFLPIGFLQGMVGQFFKQFGLTVVFAMLISSFDALTVAPMLSAYFAGNLHKKPNFVIRLFERFQDSLDRAYEYVMKFCLCYPWVVLLAVTLVFFASLATLAIVKKTFMPPNDQGEFMVYLELPPGTSLDGTYETVLKVEEKLKALKELDYMTTLVGTQEGESNIAILSVGLVPAVERNLSTANVKNNIRKILREFQYAKPKVNDFSMVGGGNQYPFYLLLMGDDLEVLDKYSKEVMAKLETISDITDIGTTYQGGKPEFQIKLEPEKMQEVGVTPGVAGSELRYHIAGGVVGKLHDKGIEYDIRMRLKPEQRDLKSAYESTFVPNMAYRMIPLSAISHTVNDYGPARIFRQDRSRVIQVYANLAPNGAIASATEKAKKILNEEIPKPPGVNYSFIGQSEDFRELIENIILAFGLALVFIYLVLASLYESFITPLTILFAIPPAISGAFFSLALTGEMLNIFSMIGIILLMGLVTKNSILLVDHAMEGVRAGLSRSDAIFKAGQTRLRPILMTSLAMIAGTLPIALGLGEAAKSRTAMGIAIIGGLFVSTLVTLIVVPAVYGYIDTFREFIESKFRPEVPTGLN
ncbi:MAG: efflux RND transporter permease subunit [Leptospiraceae bacterium]|nr:efflux RND transporter permease subunit [Leptospiraceae bacterium]MCP5493065.1 efflux RND transporter permease subunit [Leptospiraceae bacterium]